MLISDAHRFLFVHVQKTGGSTIDRRFQEVLPDHRHIEGEGLSRHARLGTILAAEPGLSSYWTVGFVRNPWARMLSWYRMGVRFLEAAERQEPWALKELETNDYLRSIGGYGDFEEFVMRGPDDWGRLRTPQVKYLTSRTRRADYIGRQETLEADLRAVFARLDLPWEPLVSRNVDPGHPDYREFYTEPLRRRVDEVFARDIAVFDYSF